MIEFDGEGKEVRFKDHGDYSESLTDDLEGMASETAHIHTFQAAPSTCMSQGGLVGVSKEGLEALNFFREVTYSNLAINMLFDGFQSYFSFSSAYKVRFHQQHLTYELLPAICLQIS